MCAAKIIPIGKTPFYLGKGREIEGSSFFNDFSPKTRSFLKEIAVFGVKNGVEIINIFGKDEASITLLSGGRVMCKPRNITFHGIEIKKRPLRIELDDGSRIMPVSERTYRRVAAQKIR